MNGQVADYVATLRVSEKEKQRISHRLNDSVEYFTGHGITEPCEVDYKRLKEWLLLQPGKRKGTTMGTSAVNDWVSATKKFYEWRARSNQRDIFSKLNDEQEGMSEDMSEVSAIALPVSEQAEAVSENLAFDGENTAPEMKKRGRRVKPENERRSVKISIYLTPTIYDGMKALSAVSMQDISDIFFTLASEFVERNAEKLKSVQSFLAELGAIK